MTIRVDSYSNCCSVFIVSCFGTADSPEKPMIEDLQSIIKLYYKTAVALSAITNIDQKAGERVLKKMGFTRSRKLRKQGVKGKKSPYNKIHIWYFELVKGKVDKALAVTP